MIYHWLIRDIDFSELDAWWKSFTPPIEYEPTYIQASIEYISEDYICITGWKVNVKSRIFEFANSSEVRSGWNLIGNNLKILGFSILQLFIPIFKSMLIDYNTIMNLSGKSNPSIPISARPLNFGIISLLQLAYWYNKCSVSSTFNFKEVELRGKLTGFIKAYNESSNDLESKLEKMRNDIDDCVSELMFAGLAIDYGAEVSFKNTHDFLINDIPCEVKTIHDEIFIVKGGDDKLVPASKKENFGILSLKIETLKQIMRKKYKKHIMDAIEQGGRIIFINSSFSTVAHNIASVDFGSNVDCNEKFNQLLQNAVKHVQSNSISYLPVIVSIGLQADRRGSTIWYQTYYSFNVAIMISKDRKAILDESKYDEYNLINSLDVKDIRFRKYPL